MNEELIGELIRQENEMTNHRMNWFLILQGFLFAGIAFAWEKSNGLVVVFSCVGVLSSLSVGVLLYLGIDAIRKLHEGAGDRKVIGKRHDEISFVLHMLLPWNFLPVLFMLAWACMAMIKYLEN